MGPNSQLTKTSLLTFWKLLTTISYFFIFSESINKVKPEPDYNSPSSSITLRSRPIHVEKDHNTNGKDSYSRKRRRTSVENEAPSSDQHLKSFPADKRLKVVEEPETSSEQPATAQGLPDHLSSSGGTITCNSNRKLFFLINK